MFKKGDLIKNKRSGILAEVTRDGYTFRFMDAEDHDMVAHGMGDMAGGYGTAYNATYLTGDRQGNTVRLRGSRGWAKVEAGAEAGDVKVKS